ncbi:MAG: carbohydrate ABC transporter permease [Firmicutes bacterium]|nr:carbohydrate ABC transporter permease [Candidatus Colimorpha enterica]
MNNNTAVSENAPKIKRETKNTIKVDFERTNFWTRFKLKYLTSNALVSALWWLFRFILLLGISYVILQPFYSKFASSFMGKEDFVDVTVKLIPKHPTLDTYAQVIKENRYFEALLNTTILSLSCAVLQTISCSLIGYGLSKYKFKGNKLIFALVIFTMIIPHKTLHLALYMKFRYFDIGVGKFGLFNLLNTLKLTSFSDIKLTTTYWPFVILSITGLGFKNGLFIFMMRQFFKGVPDELEESAYIDGYGPLRTFFKIIIPISIPMMITIFLFAFSWQWTDNFYVETFIGSGAKNKLYLLPQIVTVPKTMETDYAGKSLYETAIRNTCGLLIIYPLIVVYLFCQKYLVQGIERSGIVG